jgi:hypothetical protein
VNVSFERGVFGLQGLLGYRDPQQFLQTLALTPKLSLLRGVDFSISPQRSSGWLEITYLDDDLRIGRGNQGNLFAFAHAQHCRAVKIVLSMRELVSRRECSIVLVRHHSCSLECYALGSSKIRDGGKFCPQGVHVGAKE